ncbi:phosphoenolpyruvate--protein phosphotransferase [Microvirga sp. SRT01]|uniref:phosphoenolpyruvate--protein phosphotransferase n=1 Tax=Sphingomonas longa TaxID=2778730 RepID=A0ABS2DAC5_9SPHN|nr:phosphoenolpyruvate--protein phosphotransferase [Microvirga sp. SRT01]MBM6577896.1 phosphoenolpyruvate--protein phosphotransferase [Sphingomonas sp. BT552]MBR7710937.1 phosphoenolpyruvate--protein phosphotransferase [Microvirga sp. SRT01]
MSAETLVAPLGGWLMTLAAVPDQVFAEGMMGAGVAIDPTGDTLHAPCAATVLSVHAAGHAVTLRTAGGAEVLIHIGIDTVAMGGEGFERLVEPGQGVTAGTPLIRFDLDLIAQRASALATPIVLTSGDDFRIEGVACDGLVEVGAPLLRLVPTGAAQRERTVASTTSASATVVVALPHGIHARPAARIAAAVRAAGASATLTRDDRNASALSVTGMLGLDAVHGSTLTIAAQGGDAEGAVAAVVAILTAHEDADPPAPRAVPVAPAEVADGALAGVPAAPGLAIGIARWLRVAAPEVPPADDVATERERLVTGIARLRDTLAVASGHSVLAAHRAILDDPDLEATLVAAVEMGEGAAAAALSVTRAQAARLARSSDARIAERGDDLIDIGQRLAHAVLGTEPDAIVLPSGTILLADDLLPSQLTALDATALAGIAVVRGGPTSHVAIMAAGLGVPMLVALGEPLAAVPDGATLILDGDAGSLLPDPDAPSLNTARAKVEAARLAEAEALAAAASGRPAATADGLAVGVHVNLGSAAEAAAAVTAGAEGCGLLRTELLFLERATAPTRDEQASEYRAIGTALGNRPLTIRLLDIGGDKPAPYLAIAAEENPALGLRGVRVVLAREDVLETQVAAILDAADGAPCRIMVPMVASVAELDAVRVVVDRLRGSRPILLGAMIETPAAAIGADLIARRADFLSIGSNDLTQYTLAMDRGNPAVAAGLDGLHPAVLRLVAATCEGAARHGVPVGVCGGLAADPLAVPILVGLGVTSLSVPAGRIAATRAGVAAVGVTQAHVHALQALACESAGEVRTLARRFAEETVA